MKELRVGAEKLEINPEAAGNMELMEQMIIFAMYKVQKSLVAPVLKNQSVIGEYDGDIVVIHLVRCKYF